MDLFEIVEIQSPLGGIIKCAKQGSVLVPIDKITVFGMGKVEFPERQELDNLKKERRENQREFSKNFNKQKRLEELEKKEHNYQRSQGNLKAILKAGLEVTNAVIDELILHLLNVGNGVMGTKIETRFSPLLIIESCWRVLPSGEKYLTTLILKTGG